MALESHIKKYEGIAFFIENEKTRDFQIYNCRPKSYFFKKWILSCFKKISARWPSGELKKALDEIDSEREIFLNILMPPNNGILIALHNNFRGYNVKSEISNSQRVSIKNQNPRDFIICTDENDFDKISRGPFNVVLQNIHPELDDGSLSWEALRRNVRYINLETRLGYLTQQKKC